jgi:hypothetical protein
MSGDNKTAITIISIISFTCILCVVLYQELSIKKTEEETKQFDIGLKQQKERTIQIKYSWKIDSVNATITTDENK